MWEYSDKVKEHFTNPKNVGSIENADAIGEAGALSCGDKLKLYLKIDAYQRYCQRLESGLWSQENYKAEERYEIYAKFKSVSKCKFCKRCIKK